MSTWQVLQRLLPTEVKVQPIGQDEVAIGTSGAPAAHLRLVAVDHLTRAWLETADRRRARETIVLYERSSPESRAALRRAGFSYVGVGDGRVLIRTPGLFVERDERATDAADHWEPERWSRTRNPFALRASRVPRWLLLHPEAHTTVGSIAAAVELSESVVSRAVQALDDEALLESRRVVNDARKREIHLTRPRALLAAWERSWERRRIATVTWDVGARDASEVAKLLRTLEPHSQLNGRWAIGGLAGASRLRPAVEVVDVLVWIDLRAIDWLARELHPHVTRGRGPARGAVRVAAAPDPWVLGFARPHDGLPVADPVQLWLDCATEGERALEAAGAIAELMRW